MINTSDSVRCKSLNSCITSIFFTSWIGLLIGFYVLKNVHIPTIMSDINCLLDANKVLKVDIKDVLESAKTERY